MKHDLSLPPPGALEPEGKPSKDVKIGQKPVLPPPAKPLDEDEVKKAAQKAKSDAVAERAPPVTAAPPIDMRVEREALRPAPEPMKREKSKSGVSKLTKKKKAPHKAASMMDDEVAVVTRDPRKPRAE